MLIPRRSFLFGSLPALAGALTLPCRAAPASPALGFSLYGMRTLPLGEALRACANIGYRNVELACQAGWPAEPQTLGAAARRELRTSLSSTGLSLSSLMLNLSLLSEGQAHSQNLQAIAQAAQLAYDLSPDAPPVLETVMGGKSTEWDEKREALAARLKEWAEAAHRAGITLAVKAHVSSAVNSPERLLWLLQQVPHPSLGIDFDYSHFELAGRGLEECLTPLLPHTRFVHVKDTVGNAEQFRFLLPGQGRTDYRHYFSLLRAGGYHGAIVVEVSAQISREPGYDPLTAARTSYQALAPALAS